MRSQSTPIPGARDFYSGKVGTVDVDSEIAEVVTILNAKGFETIASCAGHFDDPETDGHGVPGHGYIWMKTRPVKAIPSGFYYTDNRGDGGSLRWIARSKEKLERRHAELLEWARSI